MKLLTTSTLALLASCLLSWSTLSYAESNTLWSQIKSGQKVVLMRHALAPGVGDPSNFQLGDCSTQRNLSARGIEQAKAIGDEFRNQGISNIEVFTSQWCRCQDTAENLELGEVTPLPLLNSFFQGRGSKQQQTNELKTWLAQRSDNTPAVLVTHQVNITALTGVFPASGEMVLVEFNENGKLTSAETLMVK